MVGVKETATSAAGVGVGVGSTVLIRQQLDAPDETSVLRPSVLWGVGTGLLGMGAPMVLGNGRRNGAVMDFVEDYSAAALASGVTSALVSGGSIQTPSL